MKYYILLIFLLFGACTNQNQISEEQTYIPDFEFKLWELENKNYPEIATSNYIEIEKIEKVSKFRSGVGHDYSDFYEKERSMKHYFIPYSSQDTINNWKEINIFSPIDGKVWRIEQEWAASQIWIESTINPAFKVVIFHVNLSKDYKQGDLIKAGEKIGNHGSLDTYSDIAVAVWINDSSQKEKYGYKYISYFDIINQEVLNEYLKFKSVNSKEQFIISKESRDKYPNFDEYPNGENVVYLTNRNREIYSKDISGECNLLEFTCSKEEFAFFDDDGCGCEKKE